ncbi:MAG: biotin transporter BioY [Ruminococcus sp.]|nr:biotin transporter BioY [Ruminococcus sp.]
MCHNKMNINVRDITRGALFAALTAVLSQISLPMPSGVPATLQTFAVALCGYMLGKNKGSLSIMAYILLGAAGLPVFTGFKGGFAALSGITGGFIWGFLPMTFLCGLGADLKIKQDIAGGEKNAAKSRLLPVLLGTAGTAALHFCGVIQFSLIRGGGFWESALLVSFPFLIKDILSVILAFSLSEILRRQLKFM